MPEWKHRIVEHPAGVFAVRQVHYNHGRAIGMSLGPSIFKVLAEDETDASVQAEIHALMERALQEARSQPILRPPPEWL